MKDEALKNERPDRSEKQRVPLAQRNIISFKQEDGYVYRLVNDKGDRLKQVQSWGYEFVESGKNVGDPIVGSPTKIGKRVSKPVGNNTTAYLMRIKQEFYDEDRKAKDKIVDDSEKAMKPNKRKGEHGEGLVTEKI